MADVVRSRARGYSPSPFHQIPRAYWDHPPVNWSQEVKSNLRRADAAAAARRYQEAELTATIGDGSSSSPRSARAQTRRRQEQVEAALREQQRLAQQIRYAEQRSDTRRHLIFDEELQHTRPTSARHVTQAARRAEPHDMQHWLTPPRGTTHSQRSPANSELHTPFRSQQSQLRQQKRETRAWQPPKKCVARTVRLTPEQVGRQPPVASEPVSVASCRENVATEANTEQQQQHSQERQPIDAELRGGSVATAVASDPQQHGAALQAERETTVPLLPTPEPEPEPTTPTAPTAPATPTVGKPSEVEDTAQSSPRVRVLREQVEADRQKAAERQRARAEICDLLQAKVGKKSFPAVLEAFGVQIQREDAEGEQIAEKEAIAKAYKKAMVKYHPDRAQQRGLREAEQVEAEETYKLLQNLYENYTRPRPRRKSKWAVRLCGCRGPWGRQFKAYIRRKSAERRAKQCRAKRWPTAEGSRDSD